MPVPRLDEQKTALLVVDFQKKLLPHIHEAPSLLRRAARLVDGFHSMRLPMIVTEQYPQGLGPTVPQLAKRLEGAVCMVEKLRFSACVEPVMDHLDAMGAKSVVVCGIEAHVCVLQTVLDLLDAGYTTALVLDAIGSRRPLDATAAEQRMIRAGALPTTVESVLFELAKEARGDRFKAIRNIVR
jgi:nicotinamidase-related amidase